MSNDHDAWAEREVNSALRTRKKKNPAEMYHVHLPESVRTQYRFEKVGFMGARQVWRCPFCFECMIFTPEDSNN